MLKVFFLISFLLFTSLGCYVQHYLQEQKSLTDKKEVLEPFVWNFGQVKEGAILEHKFVLKNESQKVLNIKDVNTSCGCIVSKVEKKNLLPGEATFIDIKFDTKGYSGPTQQFVYIHTDNLDNPVLRFIIKADIVK